MLIYLIPPSEGKAQGGEHPVDYPQRYFDFPLPQDIANQASEKELKCTGNRYAEGSALNKSVTTSPLMPAIHRYTGVMFKAIGYESLDQATRSRFDQQVLITSGMYGMLQPHDPIANYKLPVGTKQLYIYRKELITSQLISYAQERDAHLIDLLPLAHKKLIDRKVLERDQVSYTQVNFYKNVRGERKKYTHGVKSVKGQRLRQQLQNNAQQLQDLEGVMDSKELQVVLVAE